ncbi:hypothetical protein T4A_816 [Trichinella pseudospiralis]|uniref:HMG box domain-containing protein n=1 Tax=Trichinella pseudospiralis TaxID=6337 RepID=A0A0V1IZS2_TRIPS|nr:hypothetical protein T4E_11259 [Trichinella pseudospiralis]KRY71232.1 hypothetical protein T4A_816 [Trichinella pseudospiralis]KRZ28156.1 hypothetical protein T4C_3565 [Trichinella pseudospiralis]
MWKTPTLPVSPYVYYVNWNLKNCKIAITERDFECIFLMCDRKWDGMSSEERQQWRTKAEEEEKTFQAHPLLLNLLTKIKGNAFDQHPPMCSHHVEHPPDDQARRQT